ncbi:MAG: mechanosensitive ion channel family protein [Phycisphaerales bacterium]
MPAFDLNSLIGVIAQTRGAGDAESGATTGAAAAGPLPPPPPPPPGTIRSFLPPEVAKVLEREVLGNTIYVWIVALVIALVVLVVLPIMRRWLIERVKRGEPKDGASASPTLRGLPIAVLSDLRAWFIAGMALFAGLSVPVLPEFAWKVVKLVAIVIAALQVLITSRLVVDAVLAALMQARPTEDGRPDPSIQSASGIIRFMVMLVLITLLVLLAMSNMGMQITPLLTGLGIGGIAVALAVQSVLGDLFGSLTIVLDKPFLVGDFIIAGDKMGTVERIGIKTTRVRALSGEQLVFSNNDLLTSRIQNYKRMFERRVVVTLNVVYETPIEKLRLIPGFIRESIETQGSRVRFDRSHFKTFAGYSLDFEYVYWVMGPDFNVYMDIQQAINFEILTRFKAHGIEFAYPTAVEIQRPDQPRLPAGSAREGRLEPAGTGSGNQSPRAT